MSITTRIPLLTRVQQHDPARTAVLDSIGSHTYGQLLDASARIAAALLESQGDAGDLAEARVAFLVSPSAEYVATQWAIWQAGGIAVPLCTMHPPAELDYVLGDADVCAVVADEAYAPRLAELCDKRNLPLLLTHEAARAELTALPNIAADRAAMIVYTSGTTSRPKGAVTTHANMQAQVSCLIDAWGWTCEDRILHLLPLHHVHGIVNVLCCAMWAGAVCDMMPKFDVQATWQKLIAGDLTLFMAVPTVYARMTKAFEQADAQTQQQMTEACKKLRLMVSGSAALPVTTLQQWQTISGHTLLERYGMTEIGMALSNPLDGQRLPGHVGSPLPGVEVRLVDEQHQPVADNTPGEIQVKGPNVFREYWRRPQATADSFVDGWFKTGDVAVRIGDVYRILGRNSVDIIKTGGYKVSALEIEEVLRTHPAIDQCAVVGIEDPEWGERVSVAVELRAGQTLDLKSLRDWAKEHLAVYKVPAALLVVEELPRNAMGKVTKPDVTRLFEQQPAGA